jgi:membrane dipeptidase
LSAQGRELVIELNRLGMIVDLAHASFKTTRDVVEMSSDPVMISHTHLRHDESDHPRLIGDEHAKSSLGLAASLVRGRRVQGHEHS